MKSSSPFPASREHHRAYWRILQQSISMRDHIKVLGILNIVMGSLTVLIGIGALLAMGTLAGFIVATISSATGSDVHDGAVAAPIIVAIGFVVATFFLVLGLPAIVGGWGLMHYRRWSRILMIIVSFFHLFHIPLARPWSLWAVGAVE